MQLCFQTIPLVLHSVALTWVTFLVAKWETILGYWWLEKVLLNPNFYDIVSIHSLMIYSDIVEYNIVGDTQFPLIQCFLFILELKEETL